MSYLGSIGFIMDGSGLEELWSTVYAPQSVKKLLSGHAYSRAIRAHILTFTAIAIKICRMKEMPQSFGSYVRLFFQTWESNPPLIGDFDADLTFKDLTKEFSERIQDLEERSKTAKLWIQYFKCVTIALKFIQAERLGNWRMHLAAVKEMLPIFHAAGHFAYAKSAQIYLQDMMNLEQMMDDNEFSNFINGFFTVHRADKAWCGTWTDMVIEQTLNRFFGTDLKHGRGVTPNVVARYLLAMPSAFSVMECLENFCNVKSRSSEQHVDISKSRMKIDEEHISTFLFWLNEHDPFKEGINLISLSNGVVGGEEINCHMAFEKGLEAMTRMVGKSAQNITMSTVYKVKPLSSANTTVHTDNMNMIKIDPTLLFQRISVIFAGNSELTEDALSYELAPFPSSLFCENGFMRKNTKSDLYKIFEIHLSSQSLIQSFTCVVDGGWLLHKLVWPHGKKYSDIFELYKNRLIASFGLNVTVVFDGYNNEIIGTKSYERYRRKEKIYAADIDIDGDKLISLSQKQFLSNVANKYKFVKLLVEYLKGYNIDARIATEDADTMIVNTAIQLKNDIEGSVAIVGNDIDLFVIAVALTPDDTNIFFHKKGTGKVPDRLYSTSDNKEYKPFILFAHAFAGCDTTSAIFNKGKLSIIKMLHLNEDLQNSVSIFCESEKTENDLFKAAEKIMIHLYSTRYIQAKSINELRYKLYPTLVITTKKQFPLASLPPTDAALLEHVKRVYYQIQQWLGKQLNPESWGWKRTSLMLIPVMTKKAIAPEQLLQKISCGCQKNCSTGRCTCKKAGLSCTAACRHCNGESCDNSSSDRTTFEDEFDYEFEIDEEENRSNYDLSDDDNEDGN